MIRIEASTAVAAAPERAFAFVTRIEDYPVWLPGVLVAEPLAPVVAGDGPAPGTRFRLVSEGPGGTRIESKGEVRAVDPPRSVSIAATSGFFALTATCAIDPLEAGGSRIGVRAEIEPRGLATLAAGRIEQELRAAVPDTLARLREALAGTA
jgi:carbon monoxide dehydrogenase subunit G